MSLRLHVMNTVQSQFTFLGFASPNTTSVPDQAFDEIMPMVTPAQWKVLCYIIRRTYGFKKPSDNISLKQICTGIVTKQGKVLDRGTGLSKSAVAEALNGYKDRKTKAVKFPGLIEMGIVLLKQNTSRLGDFDPNTYALHMKSEDPAPKSDSAEDQTTKEAATYQEETDIDTSVEEGGSPFNGLPMSVKQTTVVRLTNNIQTDSEQPSSFTNPDSPDSENVERREEGKKVSAQPRQKLSPTSSTKAASAASSKASSTSKTPTRSGEVMSVSAVLQGMLEEGVLKHASEAPVPDPTKASGSPGRHQEKARSDSATRFPADPTRAPGGTSQPRIRSARISQLVKEICEEFHDPKIKGTTTQIHNIWWQTNYPEDTFEEWLRMLRSEVRQRQREGEVRRPMGYFMQVLKNSLLRPPEQA